ncbi:hypothetical protein I3760_05G214300 [Carya illinoinensis]|nr:hypothetical protein I3760_05G214300 [Carya illinoinensis]
MLDGGLPGVYSLQEAVLVYWEKELSRVLIMGQQAKLRKSMFRVHAKGLMQVILKDSSNTGSTQWLDFYMATFDH